VIEAGPQPSRAFITHGRGTGGSGVGEAAVEHDAGPSAIDNGAPRARTISAAFSADFNEHFAGEGHGIFSKIYNDAPIEYWSGLIALAKVTKIEMGTPGDFDHTA
jgi:hypothetical protein